MIKSGSNDFRVIAEVYIRLRVVLAKVESVSAILHGVGSIVTSKFFQMTLFLLMLRMKKKSLKKVSNLLCQRQHRQ
jgi:hypothetical protein